MDNGKWRMCKSIAICHLPSLKARLFVSARRSKRQSLQARCKQQPLCGLSFTPPAPAQAEAPARAAGTKLAKPPRVKKEKAKFDPQLLAAARELRDRWLEMVNSGQYVPETRAKYDVSRALPAPTA